MKTDLQVAKCLAAAQKTIEQASKVEVGDPLERLAIAACLTAAGMLTLCAWMLGCASDPPDYDKITDAEAFKVLEKLKDEWENK